MFYGRITIGDKYLKRMYLNVILRLFELKNGA